MKTKQDQQPPTGTREISSEVFFSTVGKMDVHPTPTGDWPYLTEWRDRAGNVYGWSKSAANVGPTRYFVR